MEDRIEKSIEINAPVARVWRALTDHREFGEWFRVELTGAFIVGEVARGHAMPDLEVRYATEPAGAGTTTAIRW